VWHAKAVRHIIRGSVIAGHRGGGRPSEVVVEHLSQLAVVGESRIGESMVEAGNGTTIHLVVLAIPAVYLDDHRLVTIGVGVNAGAAERLGPIGG